MTDTPYLSPTPSFSASPTFSVTPTITLTETPTNTGTPTTPAVLSTNVFRTALGQPLQISFKVQHAGRCWITIYNLAGERVLPLYEGDVQAGQWHQAYWDGKNDLGEWVGSGVYFVSVKGAGIKAIRKVVVLK